MSRDQRPRPTFFSQVDISQMTSGTGPAAGGEQGEQTRLLREILAAQDRQNELLEEMVSQLGAAQRQKANELGQWKQANPGLARKCRKAAEALSKVQTEFLANLTDEIRANCDALIDGEFMFNEFIDRVGPRLAHLNGVLQLLAQLSSTPDTANTPNSP